MLNLPPGTPLGAYQVVELIGHGGMAVVYKAYHAALDRHVAIKVLAAGLSGDAEFLARFQHEARTVARLRHPHILEVYDFGEHEGLPYLVMEYLPGGTLAARLAHRASSLPAGAAADAAALLDEACTLAEQLGSALDHAHGHGFVHRDVKPNNIFLAADGSYVLGDFGLAQMLSTSVRLTRSGESWGSPAYMSPEQAQGLPTDPRSDVYSTGVVLYEVLTGRPPFQEETPWATLYAHVHRAPPPPSELDPALSPGLDAVLLCALAKAPADRYATAGALARDLVAAARGLPPEAVLPATIQAAAVAGGLAEGEASAVRGDERGVQAYRRAGDGADNGHEAAAVALAVRPHNGRPPAPSATGRRRLGRTRQVLVALAVTLLLAVAATVAVAIATDLLTRLTPAPVSDEPPELVEWSPVQDAEGVALRPMFVLGFSEPMDRRSVQEALVLEPLVATEWKVDWQNRDRKLLASPKTDLLPETTYTLAVGPQARDRLGRPLVSEVELRFTTGPAPPPRGAAAATSTAVAASPTVEPTPLPTATQPPSATPTPPPPTPTESAPVAAPPSETPSPEPTPEATETAPPTATVGPGVTSTRTPVPTRVPPSPSPSRQPSPTATATPLPQACPAFPVRGFGKLWEENIGVRASLGCARAAESAVDGVAQTFEGGVMLWRSDTREIDVLIVDLRRDPAGAAGRWQAYRDTYQDGDPEPTVTPAPPPTRLVPARGFGKVWREQPGVREQLGYATQAERPFVGAVQSFEGGRMLWTGEDERLIWVLHAGGEYQRFVDAWRP